MIPLMISKIWETVEVVFYMTEFQPTDDAMPFGRLVTIQKLHVEIQNIFVSQN